MKNHILSVVLVLILMFTISDGVLAADKISEPMDTQSVEHTIESPDSSKEPDEATEPDPVINVIVPMSLDFTIDPLELSERGQIYSETYVIENQGDADALLTITDINYTFANDTDFEALPQPLVESYSTGLKAIYMMLDFERSDVEPIIITDPERTEISSIVLHAAGGELSSCFLSLTGSVNPYPDTEWLNGDVIIFLTYQIDAIPPEEEAEDIALLPEEDEIVEPQTESEQTEPEDELPLEESEQTEPEDELPLTESEQTEPEDELPLEESEQTEPEDELPLTESEQIEPKGESPITESEQAEPESEPPMTESGAAETEAESIEDESVTSETE